MPNQTIPLRRVRRRKHSIKMQQAHELSLQITANSKSTSAVMSIGGRIIHRNVEKFEPKTFPSGGLVLRGDIPSEQELADRLGYDPQKHRQLIEAAIQEASEEGGILSANISDITPPSDGCWKDFRFVTITPSANFEKPHP